MSETGQGFLDEGKVDELHRNIKNLWGRFCLMLFECFIIDFPDKFWRDFLWYMRMHTLMGTSPVMVKNAVSNSSSLLNLDMLS